MYYVYPGGIDVCAIIIYLLDLFLPKSYVKNDTQLDSYH